MIAKPLVSISSSLNCPNEPIRWLSTSSEIALSCWGRNKSIEPLNSICSVNHSAGGQAAAQTQGEIKVSEQVSSFMSTQIGAVKYLFYITSWSDFQTTIAEVLNHNWEKFGEALGQQGKIIKPYDSANHRIFDEILSKPWSAKISDRMRSENDPFMIVTKVSFAEFNPSEDEWAIIWFSEFLKSPEDIPYTLKSMAVLSREEGDLIEYLNKASRTKEMASYADVLELKPGIFGCSIDLKMAVKKLFNIV